MQNYTITIADGDEEMLQAVIDNIKDTGVKIQHVFKTLRLIIVRTNKPEILKGIDGIISIEEESGKSAI